MIAWSGLFRRENIKHWLLVTTYFAIVLSPVAALMADLSSFVSLGDAGWVTLVVPMGRRLDLFFRSLGLAAAVAAASMALSIMAGSYLWGRRNRCGLYLRRLIYLLIMVPPYVHALAWSAAFFAVNSIFRTTGLPEISFSGLPAAWWVQTMAFLPVAFCMAMVGFQAVDPELVDAARVIDSDLRTFREIVIPAAVPSWVSGGMFVFLLSLQDYSVASLFQVNTYALEIFAEYSASHEPVKAFLLAVPLLLVTALAIGMSQGALRQYALRTERTEPSWLQNNFLPLWFTGLQRLAVIAAVLMALAPVVSLTAAVKSWTDMNQAVGGAQTEVVNTLWTGLFAAAVCLPLALAVAVKIQEAGRFQGVWWLAATMPLALPGPLVGVGLIAIWNQPGTGVVYGTAVMPVLAGVARFAPLAAVVIAAQLKRLDMLLIDAARILQTNSWQTLWRIKLPLLLPGLLAAFSIVFVLTAGELGASVLVAPPGQVTLTIKIYNYLHYGATSAVAGLCLFMLLAAVAAGGLVMRLFNSEVRRR